MRSINELLVEDSSKDGSITNRTALHDRYSKLVGAIEFFSQRFSLENMTRYMYDFTLKLLNPESCVFFVKEDLAYQVFETTDERIREYRFKKEEKHDQMVYFHAGLLEKKHMHKYVPEDIVQLIQATVGIPVIQDKELYGLLLIKKDVFTEDEIIIAEALMNLFHLSVSYLHNYTNLEIVKKELDEKIFNLFAINQASKALMSELDPNRLIELSLSVFSEMTQSRITSIFMYDVYYNAFVCMGAKDVYNKVAYRSINLRHANTKQKLIPVVVRYDNEEVKKRFSRNIADDISALEYYQPEYIISLVSDEGSLLGFVTISQRVNGEAYEKSIFELVESLASSTYVAHLNAKHLEEVKAHQLMAENKFKRLEKLNVLVKNMNTAGDIGGLIDLTLTTLKVSFGYTVSFYASYENQQFEILGCEGFVPEERRFSMNDWFREVEKGKTVVNYQLDDVASSLAEIMTDELYEKTQGMIMVPVIFDDIIPTLLGVICLLDVEDGALSTDENILTLETIGNHIAPIAKQLQLVEKMKKSYIPNYRETFIEKAKEVILEAKESDTECYFIGVKAQSRDVFSDELKEKIIDKFHYAYLLSDDLAVVICYGKKRLEEIKEAISKEEQIILKYPDNIMTVSDIQERLSEFLYHEKEQ